MIRSPAVANQFYPADPQRLNYEVNKLMGSKGGDLRAKCVISPHAGYMYSGHVAGEVFSRVHVPKRCILLGPNHTGLGDIVSIVSDGEWDMPLGRVRIDNELASAIKAGCYNIKESLEAHLYEHSLEVQLPFMQAKERDLGIVPICISRINYEEARELGVAIARAIKAERKEAGDDTPLIVVSTDFTHYEPGDIANKKDRLAIDAILNLDPEGLFNVVLMERITMCGFIPTVVGLVASIELGAKEAELIKYATSGDITGDNRQVVGYAGIIIR